MTTADEPDAPQSPEQTADPESAHPESGDAEPGDVESAEAESTGAESAEAETATQDKPWWDHPSFPWRGKPSKADIGCLWAIAGMGIYGLALLPVRSLIVAANPYISAAISGGAVSMAFIGARASDGVDPAGLWVLGLLIGGLSVVKFDWVFWWAGRLWGEGLIDYLLQGRGGLARKNAARAQALTEKYGVLALAISWLPLIPFPSAIVYGALGITGMSLRKFLFLDILFGFLSRGLYLGLGWYFGEPVIHFLETYNKYAGYVTIALVVGIIVMSYLRSNRKKQQVAARD